MTCSLDCGHRKEIKDFLPAIKSGNISHPREVEKVSIILCKCSRMQSNKFIMNLWQYKLDFCYKNNIGKFQRYGINLCQYSKKLFGQHVLNCDCLLGPIIYDYIRNDYTNVLQTIHEGVLVTQQDIKRVIVEIDIIDSVSETNNDQDWADKEEYEKIVALLLAKSDFPIPKDYSYSLKMMQTAAYDLTYKRMIEVCLAMQDLDLPALVTYKIVKHACRFLCPGAKAKMNDVWKIITKIKHFH